MALIDIIMRAKDETNGVLEDGAEQIDEMEIAAGPNWEIVCPLDLPPATSQ